MFAEAVVRGLELPARWRRAAEPFEGGGRLLGGGTAEVI